MDISVEFTIRILIFKVIEISEDWASQNNRSSFWRLYLNSESTASVLSGNHEHRISAGHFHLIPAWTRFSCRNTGRTGHFYVHFDLMGIPGTLIRKYWPAPLKLPGKVSFPKITSLLKMQQHPGLLERQARVHQLVYSALAELFSALPPRAMLEVEDILQGHLRFAGLLEHIANHLDRPLNNSSLARIAHMSEGHFVRSFTQTLGQSPAKYVQERRIARASELLSFTDLPIDSISQECGFANRFHFSRIFRQIIGLPPAAYRSQKINNP